MSPDKANSCFLSFRSTKSEFVFAPCKKMLDRSSDSSSIPSQQSRSTCHIFLRLPNVIRIAFVVLYITLFYKIKIKKVRCTNVLFLLIAEIKTSSCHYNFFFLLFRSLMILYIVFFRQIPLFELSSVDVDSQNSLLNYKIIMRYYHFLKLDYHCFRVLT